MTEIDYVVDGKRGWELAWREVGWRERRRVKRAMWRGEALDHPVLAALVVGLVRRTRVQMAGRHPGIERTLEGEGLGPDLRTAQLANAEERNLAVIARDQESRAPARGPAHDPSGAPAAPEREPEATDDI